MVGLIVQHSQPRTTCTLLLWC